MNKLLITLSLTVLASLNCLAQTIEDYNHMLPKFGMVYDIEYKPTFYTGFAMKSENPNNLFIKTSRGNITRMTVVLDEYVVLTYLYQLIKRYEILQHVVDNNIIKEYHIEQRQQFNKIIESYSYQILPIAKQYKTGLITQAKLYQHSLTTLKALNPGRIFSINLDLNRLFTQFKQNAKTLITKISGDKTSQQLMAYLQTNPQDGIILAESLIPGRINVSYLEPNMLNALVDYLQSVSANANNLRTQELQVLTAITKGRFNFKIEKAGNMVNAINCDESACTLNYHEFTAIYPTGTVKRNTQDTYGNTINFIRNQGSMTFHGKPNDYEVDQIRRESYYAWVPKLNYDRIGNGFHNPAVSKYLPSKAFTYLYEKFNIPKDMNLKRLVTVARGGVSHGCNRLPTGALWEMRSVMPTDHTRMTQVKYNGSDHQDFDVFDIDADGQLEVMGVKYYIAYSLKADKGGKVINPETGKLEQARRHASTLTTESHYRIPFLKHLYGTKNDVVKFIGEKAYITNVSYTLFGAKRISSTAAQKFCSKYWQFNRST